VRTKTLRSNHDFYRTNKELEKQEESPQGWKETKTYYSR